MMDCYHAATVDMLPLLQLHSVVITSNLLLVQ